MNKPNKNVVAKSMLDGQVLLDLRSGDYFSLNSTASALWTGLTAGRTVDAIAKSIAEEYDVDASEVMTDLQETLAELHRKNFLE